METSKEKPVESPRLDTPAAQPQTRSTSENDNAWSSFVDEIRKRAEEPRQRATLSPSGMSDGSTNLDKVRPTRDQPELRTKKMAAIGTPADVPARVRFLSPFPDERDDPEHPGYTEQELRALFDAVRPDPPLRTDPASSSEEIKTFLIGVHTGVIDLETAGRRMNRYCAVGASENNLFWSRALIKSHLAAYGFDVRDHKAVFRDRQNGLRRLGYETVDDYISWPTNRLSMR